MLDARTAPTVTIPDTELAQRILPEGEGVQVRAQGVLNCKEPYLDVRPYFHGSDGEWVRVTKGVRIKLAINSGLLKMIRTSLDEVAATL